MSQRLERELETICQVKHAILCTNGTMALFNAIQSATSKKGEIISTPFTFAATTNAIIASGNEIVFANIEKETTNLCPIDVEKRINKNTVAIIPTHCFGNLCDVSAFDRLGKKYSLPIIYDASHCFGISDRNGSVLRYGKASTLSFHATKCFSTVEGGAILTDDLEVAETARKFNNFGLTKDRSIEYPGLNSKISEVQAGIGILNLKSFELHRKKRRNVFKFYLQGLENTEYHLKLIDKDLNHNYSYCPLISPNFDGEKIVKKLETSGIEAKRYFYPLTSTSAFLKNKHLFNISSRTQEMADGIVCLPIHSGLNTSSMNEVIKAIIS